jgi:hypothetical protein
VSNNSIALNFAAVRRNSVLAVGPNIDQRALQASIKTLYKIDAALTHISRKQTAPAALTSIDCFLLAA